MVNAVHSITASQYLSYMDSNDFDYARKEIVYLVLDHLKLTNGPE